MNGIYIGNNKMLIKPLFGGKLLAYADDYSLMPDLVFNGVFEPALTNYFIKKIKPGNVVIDVGANLGYYTVLFSYLVGESGLVFSYECNSKNFEILKENININAISNERVKLIKKAVYSCDTHLEFYSTEKFTGNGSLIKYDEQYYKYFHNDSIINEKVECEPLDKYNFLQHIDLIKIDIEGAELHAFKGMEELLAKNKVGEIIFELNRLRTTDNDWDELHRLLQDYQLKFNLSFCVLNEKGEVIEVDLQTIFNQDFIDAVIIKVKNENNVVISNQLEQLKNLLDTCQEAIDYYVNSLMDKNSINNIFIIDELNKVVDVIEEHLVTLVKSYNIPSRSTIYELKTFINELLKLTNNESSNEQLLMIGQKTRDLIIFWSEEIKRIN